MHIVRVPIQVGDGSIVLTGVKHDQVNQGADGEGSPDTQIVIHFHLSNGHPLEVRSDGIHLSLVNTDASVLDERGFGIVEF